MSARKSCKCPSTPSNLSGLIYCRIHLLWLSSTKWFLSSSVSSFSRCNSLSCPSPTPNPGRLSPGGKITRGILPPYHEQLAPPPPPSPSPPPTHTQENLANSVQNNIYMSGVLGWEQAPQARVASPLGRGQAAQGEGHTPGYLHPGGETNCTKAASLPVWGEGRGKLPRIQEKPVHRFGMFICTHCSLVHARVHVHFYILILKKG